MSESAPFSHRVRYEFVPYSYEQVRDLLREVVLDFGPPGQWPGPGQTRRWQFESVTTPEKGHNEFIMDFCFQDPHDATLFSLKHLR